MYTKAKARSSKTGDIGTIRPNYGTMNYRNSERATGRRIVPRKLCGEYIHGESRYRYFERPYFDPYPIWIWKFSKLLSPNIYIATVTETVADGARAQWWKTHHSNYLGHRLVEQLAAESSLLLRWQRWSSSLRVCI